MFELEKEGKQWNGLHIGPIFGGKSEFFQILHRSICKNSIISTDHRVQSQIDHSFHQAQFSTTNKKSVKKIYRSEHRNQHTMPIFLTLTAIQKLYLT